MESFTLTPPIILMLIGFGLIAAELFIGIEAGFDLVLLGTILLAGGIVANVTGDLYVALIIASVLSTLYIIFGRKFVKQKVVLATKKTNIDTLLHENALVIKAITPHKPGQVVINGEKWRASSQTSIAEDTKVKVLAIEGVTVIVEKD